MSFKPTQVFYLCARYDDKKTSSFPYISFFKVIFSLLFLPSLVTSHKSFHPMNTPWILLHLLHEGVTNITFKSRGENIAEQQWIQEVHSLFWRTICCHQLWIQWRHVTVGRAQVWITTLMTCYWDNEWNRDNVSHISMLDKGGAFSCSDACVSDKDIK